MKNTTIVSVSGYGKSLKRWRTGLLCLFSTLCVPSVFGRKGTIGIDSGAGTINKLQYSRLSGALLLLLSLCGNAAFAQVNTYSFNQAAGTYTPITGGNVLWTGYDGFDDQSTAVTLPTAFNYQGINYTSVTVSANGWVYIGAPGTTGNTPISSGYREIAPFALDLDAKSASAGTGIPEVRWQQVGSEIIIQWANVCRYTTSGATTSENLNFQVRLNTTTGVIRVVYGACVDRATPSTSYPQVGLGGGASAIYSNRTIAAGGGDWINSTAGTANNNTMAFNGTTIPSNGLTFTWTPPSCVAPSGLTSSAVTTGSATITWVAPGSGTPVDYQYEVRTSGAAGSGATGLTASGTVSALTTPVTGLTANTVYSYYVRTNCGSGDYSAWSLAGTFTTPCTSISSFPFVETFDTTSASLGCWTASAGAGASYQWTPTTSDATYGAAAPAASTRFAYLYVFLANTTYNTYNYTSPSFDLGTAPKRLVYKYFLGNGGYTSSPVPLALQVSVNGGAFTTIYSHTSANSTFATASTSPWQTNTIDLTAYAGSTVQFRYVSNSNYGGGICDQGLDQVTVENIPTCAEPGAVTVTGVLPTSATAAWTASASTPANGYQYYVAPSGTTPTATTTPTGTLAAGVLTTPLSGLLANTTYIVWVRSDCGTGNTSPWTASAPFFTGYCTPAPTSQDGSGITNFTLANVNNTTGSETGYYGNYSTQVANVSVGTTANFSVTYATGFTYGTKIWIDWNDDLDFDDAGELVYTGLSTAANPTTLSGSFAVAVSAPLGNHRLRIGGTDNDTGGTPCYNGSWGTYEDYTINAFMPPAPVVSGFTPATYCAATGVITITGTDLANATVSIGGTAITPLTTNTNTQIVATVPAGVSGTVSVTTVAGTSTTSTSFSVSTPAVFTLSSATATICNGSTSAPITITQGASAFDTYVWSPSTGVSGSAATGWTFNPTVTTEYVLMASQSAGPCMVNATVNVTVNPLPGTVTVTPATSTVCTGSVVALSVSTASTPGTYCTPVYTLYDGTDYVSNVTINGYSNTTLATALPGYANNTGTPVTTLNAGSGYTISVSVSNGSEYVGAYIDFNQDGDFTDAGEQIASSTGGNTGTISFTVPAGAASGATRLRVACRWNSAASPCNTTGYGETEDYTVNIASTTYTWSPATGLYTNAAGTTPYVAGTAATQVYALVTANTVYTATATNAFGCTATGTAAVNLLVIPAPTGSATQVLCAGSLISDIAVNETNIAYYATATGGTALSVNTPVEIGTYYVSQFANGCESQTRLAVFVAINSIVAPVVENNVVMFCNSATVADLEAEGENIKWYATATGGTELDADTALAEGTNVYYASQTIDGCEGIARAAVSVMLHVTAAPAAEEAQTFCDAATVASLEAEGTNIQWYEAAEGGEALAGDAAVTNGTYYASQTIDGCESALRTAVAVTIVTVEPVTIADVTACDSYVLPAAPEGIVYLSDNGDAVVAAGTEITETTTLTVLAQAGSCTATTLFTVTITETPVISAESPQVVTTSGSVATIADIIADANTDIIWYATEEDAANGTNPLVAESEIQAGGTYYAVATSGSCSVIVPVTVSEVLGSGHFDMASFSYYPNPVSNVLTVSYSQEITSVTVFNLLGQQVISLAPNTTEVKIDMTALAEGTYTVNVSTGNSAETIRVVKKQ